MDGTIVVEAVMGMPCCSFSLPVNFIAPFAVPSLKVSDDKCWSQTTHTARHPIHAITKTMPSYLSHTHNRLYCYVENGFATGS